MQSGPTILALEKETTWSWFFDICQQPKPGLLCRSSLSDRGKHSMSGKRILPLSRHMYTHPNVDKSDGPSSHAYLHYTKIMRNFIILLQ